MVHKIEVYDWDTGQTMFVANVEEKPSTRSKGFRLAVLWALENGVSLHRADLSGVDLSGADLSKASLLEANLSGADLSGANLYKASLSWADLSKANLLGADLSKANLLKANLSGADLSGADLSKANLSGANLSDASLSWADLSEANLLKANLSGANLYRTDLTKVNFSLKATEFSKIREINTPIAKTRILPEGSIIGWKKCQDGVLVKLRIPEEAKRSHAFGRKCRAEFADVLEVIGAKEAHSSWDPSIVYKVGERVYPDSFDENWTEECAPGIHFFITREEAEDY